MEAQKGKETNLETTVFAEYISRCLEQALLRCNTINQKTIKVVKIEIALYKKR